MQSARSHGKAAARFQPHCGVPGRIKDWYLNLPGVHRVEHPVPKMDSVQLLAPHCH